MRPPSKITAALDLPVPVVIAGIAAEAIVKRRVKDIVFDERIFSISDKAAMFAFRTFAIVAAATGTTLLALSQENNSDLEQAGLMLAFSIFALVLFYLIGYIYYNRKYSGKK